METMISFVTDGTGASGGPLTLSTLSGHRPRASRAMKGQIGSRVQASLGAARAESSPLFDPTTQDVTVVRTT